jgi:hypothetical protein
MLYVSQGCYYFDGENSTSMKLLRVTVEVMSSNITKNMTAKAPGLEHFDLLHVLTFNFPVSILILSHPVTNS